MSEVSAKMKHGASLTLTFTLETTAKIVALLKQPEFDGEKFVSIVQDFVVTVRIRREYFANEVVGLLLLLSFPNSLFFFSLAHCITGNREHVESVGEERN